ncbi:MAG: amino acid permease [Acidobacteria bacterium]|nr:amino acid permease [Acidobacteriota bacterium]MBV9437727.1 amino acid permease [Acidobacteriota bacterium]
MTTETQVRVPVAESTELVKGINLTSATTLVIGSMIGSGIFIVSAEIARLVDSPALLILAWVVTGFMTVVGALTYGELAAMMPTAGGQYVFLRESLGPLWGFLYGWSMFLVIQTGTIAAVGVAFGKFLGVLFPAISADKWLWHIGHVPKWQVGPLLLGNMDVGLNLQNLVAIAVVILLTFLNVRGLRTGVLVQNIFTFSKTAALFGLVLLGAALGRNAQAISQNFGHFWQNASFSTLHPVQVGVGGPIALVGMLTVVAVAQVGSLFSSDAWNNVTFTAAEVQNPRRNLPLSLALGTGIVTLLYIAANFVYLMVLPLRGDPHGASILSRGIQYAADDRVATAVMQQIFGGSGAALMAIAILISTFGCANGLILAGARIYYAMSQDGLFFRATGKIHPKYKTPAVSLVVQAIWTCLLCLSGTYNQLLELVMFAVIIFYILTIGGLFVLRRTRPDVPRPYRAIGYPVLPALYIILAVFIDVVLLRYKPQYTWPGLIIVLLGIPVYLFWARNAPKAESKLQVE